MSVSERNYQHRIKCLLVKGITSITRIKYLLVKGIASITRIKCLLVKGITSIALNVC